LDQDLCPEDVAILPKKLHFADSNAQSMNYLNALLQKQETHDIEEIYFDSGMTVGYDGVGNDLLKAQEEVIHNIAIRCPKLQYLCRFSREFVSPLYSFTHFSLKIRIVTDCYHLNSPTDQLSSA
jgi:hypothetical protein